MIKTSQIPSTKNPPKMSQEQIHSTSNTTNNPNKKSIPLIPKCLSPLIFIFIDSIKLIFIQNPNLFFIIYTLGALPLSVFVTSLSLSSTSRHLKSHIARLEWLYQIVDIWVEAGNVKETSQRDLKRLYRFKVVHVLPILVFSLFTLVLVVFATNINNNNNNLIQARKKTRFSWPTLRAGLTALRVNWVKPLVTSVVNVFFWIVWGHVTPVLTTAAGYPVAVVIVSIAAAVEVYVMMVFAVAMVVSVAEERVGFDAIRVGSSLMKGRRVIGWVLSGLLLLVMNLIGSEIVGVMEGEDWVEVNGGYKWMVEIGLVILLGWVIMWSYVVVTVFYCDCRKRNVVIRLDDEELVDCNDDIEN